VVFAAGWGSLVLGLFYLLIDVKGWRAWAFPLVVAGINAIFICVVPILVKLHTLREWSWPVAAGPSLTLEQGLQNSLFLHLGRVPGGVLYTLCCILFWWLVLLWMYRRKVFLRVRRRLGGRWELRLRRFGC
jgi:predicted acyltransferase